jgi:predicted nucleic acid-binding protein
VRLIVADTSPLVYLVLIDHIEILPRLFDTVLLPDAVDAELRNPLAPAPVQVWASPLSSGIEVKHVPNAPDDAALRPLGEGERAAIVLAFSIHADLVLIDERKGTRAAIDKGLVVTGTLGILRRAARRGLLNLAEAFDRLKQTNFRYQQEIMDKLLDQGSRHLDPALLTANFFYSPIDVHSRYTRLNA